MPTHRYLPDLPMKTQTSFSDLEYAAKKRRTRRDRFLGDIDEVTPWPELIAVIEPFYPKGERGRPPIGVERMLRMYVAQQCFGLSDEGIEDGERDPEMHQTKKGNQWYFGMKAHIGVDAESGLVHTVVGTAAHVNDVTQAQALLSGEETEVYADAGYQGVEKRAENQAVPVTWHVAMKRGQRRALAGTTLGELLERIEQLKASLRSKVEHPFHVVKNLFHHKKTRYRGLDKNTKQLFTLFGLANLLLARKWLLAPDGRIASAVR